MFPSTMNHRPSTILPSISVLAVLMLASLSQAQGLMLDKCLDDLAEKGSLGPVVAVMHAPVEGTADLSSLEGLAKTFGLKLFEQDGIHVLGPAECLHLYDLSPYFPRERPKPGLSPDDRFFDSLAPEQLRALGTRRGLGFHDLSEEQQSLVRAIFTGRITLSIPTEQKPANHDMPEVPSYWPIKPSPISDLSDVLTPEISIGTGTGRETVPLFATGYYREVVLNSVPIEDMIITGSLDHGFTSIGDGSYDYECTLIPPQVGATGGSDCSIDIEPQPKVISPMPPRPFGPNVLKPSQLDYDRLELQKEVQFEVRTSLRDVIALAAKESGLPLYVGPGSDQVLLYVKADPQPIGRMLKAVSLATCGAWRQVGDLFLYTLDTTGLGSFLAQSDYLDNKTWAGMQYASPALHPLRVRDVMFSIPPADGTFPLMRQQIIDLTVGLAEGRSDEAGRIPWSALTPEQQAFAMGKCDDLQTKESDQLYLQPWVSADLSFHFPAVGNANSGSVPADYISVTHLLPPDDAFASSEFGPSVWPKGSTIPMPAGIRGLLYKTAKSDTPATAVTTAAKYGFNTLLIRMYADGYTIFPSRQFPQLPGLKAEDFLRNVIAIAHSKGVRVVGVVDVLRWSNGDKEHWLYDTPELIDRDIGGCMNTEWMALRDFTPESAVQERVEYGDAFDGDFVSPFQPLVRQKLSALVSELATYDLDGLALDHTTVMYLDSSAGAFDPSYDISRGQPGFNEAARSAFVRTVGVDPVDITEAGMAEDILPTPLMPVAVSAASFMDAWKRFYRSGCDAVLETLIADWRKAQPGLPVWVVDTYREIPSSFEPLQSHDWGEFEGVLDKVIAWAPERITDYAGGKVKAVQLMRITDDQDPLYVASTIALLQKKVFPGMLSEEDSASPPDVPIKGIMSPPDEPIRDIILDFPCSDARRTEFLKLLETALPEKTR